MTSTAATLIAPADYLHTPTAAFGEGVFRVEYVAVSAMRATGTPPVHLESAYRHAGVVDGILVGRGETLCGKRASRMHESRAVGREVTCKACLNGLDERARNVAEDAAPAEQVDEPAAAPALVTYVEQRTRQTDVVALRTPRSGPLEGVTTVTRRDTGADIGTVRRSATGTAWFATMPNGGGLGGSYSDRQQAVGALIDHAVDPAEAQLVADVAALVTQANTNVARRAVDLAATSNAAQELERRRKGHPGPARRTTSVRLTEAQYAAIDAAVEAGYADGLNAVLARLIDERLATDARVEPARVARPVVVSRRARDAEAKVQGDVAALARVAAQRELEGGAR